MDIYLKKALEIVEKRRSNALNRSELLYEKLLSDKEYVAQLVILHQREDEVAQALHQHKDTSS